MTDQHTPGSWIADGCSVYALDETGRVNRFYAGVQGGYTDRNGGNRTHYDELRANGRLIAAAPGMLAALRLAEGRLSLLLRVFPNQSDECDHPTATGYVLKQVQAAITKATQP